MTKRLDYSKWDHIEVSDDEDDTHPNIDTPSLFRWRHQARVDRTEEHQQEKAELEAKAHVHKKKVQELTSKLKKMPVETSSNPLQVEMETLKKQEEEFKKKEAELEKKERLTPWNVDTLSKDGFEKTIINKPKESEVLSEEEKQTKMVSFIEKYETEIKNFGILKEYDLSSDHLRDRPHLVCSDTANYLTMWCVNLEVEGKHSLMTRVAHQTIVMQYILELAKQLKTDPRACVRGFFNRIKSAEKQYTDAFKEELEGFISRVELRAKVRIEEAVRQTEEEEKRKRLGPGGLDPVEVMETLPKELKDCFETRNVALLQGVIQKLPKDEAAYHMQRCVASGLWVTDAKAAGLTPASEELSQLQGEETEPAENDDEDAAAGDDDAGDVDSDEYYEHLDAESTQGIHDVD